LCSPNRLIHEKDRYLVYLVCFVYLVDRNKPDEPNQPDKQNKPNEPDRPDEMRKRCQEPLFTQAAIQQWFLTPFSSQIWFVLFIWLNETNQMNQINQINQIPNKPV